MQAVGRLGSYISRGVYTVSSPFHPFGGAVDIVLVEQQDGSFKSSPWYVRFGKFQGVLKAKEKVVSINVNGVDANFHMHLDHTGEAFFLREVHAEDEESMLYPPSSGYETDIQIKKRLKYKALSFDSDKSISMAEVDINNGSILTRSSSDTGDNNFQREVRNTGLNRARSLEHANIADNLLEVKWSTDIASHKPPRKDRVKVQKSKSQRNNMENSLNKPKLNEQACSHKEQEGIFSNSDLEVSRGHNEDEGIYSSCLSTPLQVRFSKEKTKVITEVSTSIDITKDTELDRKTKEDLSDGTRCDSEVSCLQLEGRIEKELNGDVSGVSIMRGYGISEEKISANGVQSPAYSESESSMGSMYCTRERTDQALNFVNKRCEEVHTPAEVLQMTTVLLPEVTRTEESTKNADVGMPLMEVSQTSQQKNCSFPGVGKFNVADSEDQTILPKPQMVNLDLGLSSAEKVEPNYAATTSSNCSLGNQVLEEKTLKAEDVSSTLTSSLESSSDCIFRKTSRPPSVYSEEEHFFFSDLDESKGNDQDEDSDSSEYVDKEDKFSDNFHLSPENSATENQTTDLGKLRVTSSPTVIPNNKDAGEKDWQQTKSSPHSMNYHSNSLDQHDLHFPLGHSLDSKSQILKQPLPEEPGAKDNHSSGESESTVLNSPSGAYAPSTPQGGNWRLWPFSFRRSTSEKVLQPLDANDTKASERPIDRDADKNEVKPKPLKKNVRVTTPTSEQLASLNLKEGKNSVTFTFSTNMLGNQQVDAQMYLWKWNTHIVISDVDGTITKSDVLGQFMPLVGVDWSQTGVTHLFSAIKENGYELLFLSARSISQAYQTRQFLVNLKQDGKVLPDGPVVISPDGLFPSLFREVIRRAPHEFKIACLEDIRALFPSDFNPFYAGFGNRDTDELSYLKVGIPRGKIFIINPRGEVAVNRRHHKKSYASLHALVNGIFPPTNKTEQEDYNSWNYWKLPPPDIY